MSAFDIANPREHPRSRLRLATPSRPRRWLLFVFVVGCARSRGRYVLLFCCFFLFLSERSLDSAFLFQLLYLFLAELPELLRRCFIFDLCSQDTHLSAFFNHFPASASTKL